jgi:hypothetical protein
MVDTPQFGASMYDDNPYVFGQADPNAVDPTMSGNNPGTNWAGYAAAAQGAAKSLNDSENPKSSMPQAPAVVPPNPAAPLGTPRAPINLDNLVNMLHQRQQQYAQAAMAGRAQPIAPKPTTYGLLGY